MELQQEVHVAILSRITGQTLDAFLEERIFTPLGMVDTGFEVSRKIGTVFLPDVPWMRISS